MLKHIPNVKIYYEPIVEVIDGKTCLFNPWVENSEKEKELLSGVNVDYVFGHLEIGGSQMSNRSGVKIEFAGGIKQSDFKNSQVYAGHIHIKQDNKNIHYVGNPYHKDRGDRENQKGITVLDLNSGETSFIENTTSPKFIKVSKNKYKHIYLYGEDKWCHQGKVIWEMSTPNELSIFTANNELLYTLYRK